MPIIISITVSFMFILLVHRIKLDLVIAQQCLIPTQTVQQLTLREALTTRARLCGGNTSGVLLRAIGAGKSAVTAYFALLTLYTSEDTLGFALSATALLVPVVKRIGGSWRRHGEVLGQDAKSQ